MAKIKRVIYMTTENLCRLLTVKTYRADGSIVVKRILGIIREVGDYVIVKTEHGEHQFRAEFVVSIEQTKILFRGSQ